MDVTATGNADDASLEPGPLGESECNEWSFAFYQKKFIIVIFHNSPIPLLSDDPRFRIIYPSPQIRI